MELIAWVEECEIEMSFLADEDIVLDGVAKVSLRVKKGEKGCISPRPPTRSKKWNCSVSYGRMTSNTCFIHHLYSTEKGDSTTNQIKNFKEHATKGDIIFTHCKKKGGLTHYGIYTGVVMPKEVDLSEHSRGGIYSHIYVHEWFPLPKVVKGTGMNRTLYEVTPRYKNGKEMKNYHNYSIPS